MVSISPRPTYNTSTPADDWRAAADMPVSPLRNFAWQTEEGFLSSYGAGTAVRDLLTPSGNTAPAPRMGIPIFDELMAAGHTIRSAADRLTGATEPSMTIDQWKTSPHYRDAIPYDPGMTESRAAALAAAFDIKMARAYFAEKDPFNTFVAQFAGQMFDPINYLPVFGPGARAAAAARFGIFGHIGINASEAAVNTAAFAMLSAPERAKFGDDVRWQAQINDIGMSALIGAVITPVLHGLGKGVELAEPYRQQMVNRIKQGVETVQNVAASRAVLDDAVVSMAVDGEAKLSPASARVLTTMNAKASTQREAAVSLKRETAQIDATKPGKVVITPSGSRVEVRPEVVELADLLKAEGALQVRDRSRAASQAQIEDIAINLDPARLMPSIEADRGAPIVGEDNIVDSGNGRVAGIRRAYEAYPEQAAAYRHAIEDQGFSTEGMSQPVLVSRRLTKLSPQARAQFNAEANMPATARMSPSELAAMDARAMTDATLGELADGPVTSADNRAFVQRFLAAIPENERGSLIDKDGGLSADGVRRIERAVMSEAFGDVDPTVIQRFSEATDDNSLAIVGAMSDVAGRWALMRRAIKSGEISAEFDITPELTTALRKLSGWREQAAKEGRPVSIVIKEGMGQLDMLDGELSLETKQLLRTFYKTDEFKQSAGRDAIRTRLEFMAKSIMHLGQPQLFGDAIAASKLGIIENANNNLEADLFAPERDRARTDLSGQGRGQRAPGADRGNGAQGSQVGKGSTADRMTERLVAAGRPAEEAAANAAMVDAFYTSMANRLGIPVAELEARHPLPEVRAGEAMDEAALGQGDPADFQERVSAGQDLVDKVRSTGQRVTLNSDGTVTLYHGTSSANAAAIRDGRAFREGAFFAPSKKAVEPHVKPRHGRDTTIVGVRVDPRDVEFSTGTGEFYVPTKLVQDASGVWVSPARAERAQSFDQSAPGNPAFDRWFGKSKATGPGGKPRVFYHGAKVDFESFDTTMSELGTHLGTVAQANSISAGNGKDPVRPGARTVPVYVKAEKPLRLEDTGGFENKEVARQLLDKGIISTDEAKRFSKETPENMKALQEAIEASGYDSVIYLNRREGVPTRKGDIGDFEERATDEAFKERYPNAQDSFIVFHPEQVKSQFNRGTFDPNDPRILYQGPRDPVDSLREYRGDKDASFKTDGVLITDPPITYTDLTDKPEGRSLIEAVATSETVDAAHATADAWVLEQGRAHGVEHLVAFDADGGLVSLGRGVKSFVPFPTYLDRAVKNRKVRYATHNHPSNGGLSSADITGTLIGDLTITAMGHKGAVISAKAGPLGGVISESARNNPQSWGDVGGMLARLEYPIRSLLQARINAGGLGVNAAGSAFSHLSNIIMHRLGVIDLRTNGADIVNASGLNVDEVIHATEKEISDVIRRAGYELPAPRDFRGDRPPGGVDGEVGNGHGAAGLPQGGAALAPERGARFRGGRREPASPDQLTLFQPGFEQQRRGQITFDDTGSLITLFKTADASTAAHEFGHHFLTMFKSLAEAEGAPLSVMQDWETVKGWWGANAEAVAMDSPHDGVTSADVAAVLRDGTSGDRVKDLAINVGLQEQWARGFESYLYDGTAPTSALARVFEQFKQWLRQVYRSAVDLKVNVSPELKGVFDRLLGGEVRKTDADYAKPMQPALDFTSPPPEPPIEGLDAAAARVGHQDTPKAMREMFGLKDDGSFDEQADIDQYREMGILTDEDEAMLTLADDAVKAADAYSETLRVAASCAAGMI